MAAKSKALKKVCDVCVNGAPTRGNMNGQLTEQIRAWEAWPSVEKVGDSWRILPVSAANV